eukprot:5888597-Pleurochrysis_carterae.AAC.2
MAGFACLCEPAFIRWICFVLSPSNGWCVFCGCACAPGGDLGEFAVEGPVVCFAGIADGQAVARCVYSKFVKLVGFE